MQIKGFKKTAGKERRPIVAKDTIANTSMVRILYGLSEGEVYGLADGAKSIRLDGTPIVNSSGQPNFAGVRYEFRSGTNDQTHIAGFSSVENEINVNVELRHDRPFVKQIKGAELSAFRIRLSFGRIAKQESNGDIGAYRIDYAIDVQTENGAYNEVLKTYIHDKTSQGYKKSHRIDLPKGKKWQVRVRRLTENANNDMIGDTMHVEAITEIIDAKLRYPNTALLGLEYDAKTFSNIAKVAARLKGMIIRVPSNYNPDTREYIGLWDGAFKMAYSNNPAWVFYDICTAKRYGLGSRLDGQMVDKWSLYRLGQYCDEKVSDGKGGQEPRFTCNVYLQNKMDAYEVLQNLAGIFRALSYWDGQKVVVDGDFPKDAVYTFARANVINGHFSYTGTRDRDRHTVAKVAWDNPENDFKTEYEIVKNDMAIAKRGIKTLDLSAFGCTSQGQAQRAGRWALMAESLETRQVSFSVGLDGFIPQIGDVINVSDELFAGRANGGRIIAINGKVITVDRTINKTVQAGDTLVINGTNGKAEYRQVTAINNDKITVIAPFEFASVEHIWSLDSADLRLMKFRVIRIGQRDEGSFDITAIQYEPQKYKAVDEDTDVRPTAISLIEPDTIKAPTNVLLSSKQRIEQGQTVTTLTISWGQVAGATSYIVQWRKSDGVWQTVTVGNTSLDIEGIYAGSYQARVAAVSAFDDASTYTNSTLTTISGKQGRPPKPTAISASGGLFSMVVSWTHAKGSEDANYTEVQVSPDGRSNIATFGQFAYPTNKHEITGLQGNLTQFYRARIVDKLGNASDWTAWVSGTTSANAGKLLDMLGGQISQSQLAQSLSTQIAKIGTIETQSNTAKTAADQLRSALANAQRTLDQASQSINTERTRISGAIRDINALQADKNAKTQELANLKNTVGGHTTSLQDLLVTTGDISQRYTQLKTQTDKSAGEITAVKQTQAGQATEINTLKASSNNANAQIQALNQTIANEKEARSIAISGLNSRFDTLAIGGRNLLRNSRANINNANYAHSFNITQAPDFGQDVIVTLWGELGADRTEWGVFNTFGYGELATLKKVADGVYQAKFKWANHTYTGDRTTNRSLNVYAYPNTGKSINRIDKIKFEIGSIPTDYTPAPEDTEQDFAQTNANMNTMRETLSNADKALSQRIDTMDSEYKAADRQTSAKLGQLEKTISDKDGSTAQRISQLQAEYNALNARTDWRIIERQTDLNALKEQGKYFVKAANNPNAPTTNWIYVTVDYAFNRRIKQEVWADNYAHQRYVRLWMDNRWSDWEQTPSFADVANKASQAALTAEQNARAEADRAHAESLKQLNSRVDGNASRITTVERTANDTKQALAVAQSQLNASYTNLDNKVNNLSIGGRNLILNSRITRDGYHAGSSPSLAVSDDVAGATILTLSVDIEIKANPNTAYALANRAGISTRIVYTDNTTQWFEIWQSAENYKGRMSRTFVVPSNKTVARFDVCNLQTRLQATKVIVKNPKLERGSVATDWTLAPEDNDALIDEFKQVQATKDGAIAQKLSTLQTTVNGQTASIEQHAQSLNGLQAQWTLKMQTGGVVGGIGLAGNNGVIDFAINANKFYIAPPTGGKGVTPFVVLTSPQMLNGVRVPAGTYIKSAFIQDGSIDIAKINKASINSLSALSANIGHFKSAQTGARLEIKDSVLLVYDANNRLRVRLGVW